MLEVRLHRPAARLLATLAAVALLAVVTVTAGQAAPAPSAAAPSAPTVASVAAWKLQAAPMAWSQGRIYYNQKNSSGVFDGWSANPDGSDARCVTCGSLYPAGTQHGISDVTSDGKYALATVERSG